MIYFKFFNDAENHKNLVRKYSNYFITQELYIKKKKKK